MLFVIIICVGLAIFMLYQPLFKAGKYKDFNGSGKVKYFRN